MYNEGIRTFTAYGAITDKARVKIKSGSTTSPVQVEIAGAGEQHVGIADYAVADGELVAVKLRTYPGTHEGVAKETLAVGAILYAAAAGGVKDTSDGTAIGIALEAATGVGDIIEFIDFTVISAIAAGISIADAGNFTATATVEAALEEIFQALKTANKTVPIALGAITMEDGTVLTKQATTVAGIAQIGNKEQVIDIPVGCTSGENLGFTVPLPSDIDITGDITINVLVSKDADLDVLTLDCEVYPDAAGDLANADIQDTAAQTIVAAGTVLTFTCGADGLLASPSVITVVLALGGTNDGDAVYIHGAWVGYKAKLLTA
jgi:hypothetical protein